MAIEMTWRNVGVLVAVISGLMVAFFSGTGAMMEWRIHAVQQQLEDRMTLYRHGMDQLERRMDRIERQH